MKKILIFITIITFGGFYALSQNCATQQDCENGNGISTNPNNPINNNCPERRNNFDWRVQRTDGNQEDYIVYGSSSTYKDIQNPFTGPSGTPHFGNLTSYTSSDYQPEDGWELIKVDFGSEGTNKIDISRFRKGTYIIIIDNLYVQKIIKI